ncbi:MAG: DNA-binding protein [Flavobacteriaceae bacterium CG18_big_fil_WC_8_21_14_2_50_34_36]|nr:PUR family DNA/RNA-binding protein [Flavobacteriia bacterium]PIQ19557.1 MAG: DNA-binding protein [Flavobacteriaceae bacterium CG18_big_fil_WC_8_21_14_2_50_34_36]PIV48575.1 MAG: DNA-binding protein [Flavobacteriaceae bacterium CG02_land_8_20_14_3_00_34_13]PIZ07380.1 MAG: DNA-binding protein [Flavobacteriaceae bacterium CG_4_10_14_0_8_um_filter_34_31]PJC07776.1 MAG: DNA-binding protein [Flavobacteriaceae bacterium CG_4_9_14_0_8_um_filter_34_30]
MSDNEMMEQEEIYSKVLRAGRRTYFFDVRATKAGDYYLTITESKKFTNDDGSFHYKKHKIYLYKEDFASFRENINEMIDYIIEEKGEEVISERHQKDFKKENGLDTPEKSDVEKSEIPRNSDSFTNINFEDI